ncbi:MFS transporter [Beijerinckia indica]|uniref:Major facilitator superfamily MFS_1 n=1 Tax=Beijerinckia indica subsp. indica (strain ATCC 9039 / DSM 1715 / NCIMB 8712) TaxID=395963 RepID=B2IFI6_BEII9|nr:MFS transporter [Beijerinckia indica]ACB97082.1 major facilitator superfamily MFS_1 [Beijerinckia indica subsp. indica ATCC 9039]
MGFKPKATHGVLALLCVMYFLTYVDRVNIGTAASGIQRDLGLTNIQLGFVFSAFAYPYLLFQIFGGWICDHCGPRQTLFWCGVTWAIATILTGFAGGLTSLVLARLLLGFGEGATFPTATRSMQSWVPIGKRGFAQGLTHAFSRLGNAVTPPIVAALMIATTWRGSFILLGVLSFIWSLAWVWYFRNDPKDHPHIQAAELETLPVRTESAIKPKVPWGPLARQMWPVTLTYFCYGWCLWLYLNWLPLFFKNNFNLDIQNSALFAFGIFFAGVVGDTLGGLISDRILHRTGNLRLARLGVVVPGFVGALLSLLPLFVITDRTIVTLCLTAGFFFAELVIGPMWSIPMDIAPKFSGTAAGLMNIGSAAAAIVSPLAIGLVIDMTGNWKLPFNISIGLLLIGTFSAFLMHPEKQLTDKDPSVPFAKPLPAE